MPVMLPPAEQLRARRDEYARLAGRELARYDTARRLNAALLLEQTHGATPARRAAARPAATASSHLAGTAHDAARALHVNALELDNVLRRLRE